MTSTRYSGADGSHLRPNTASTAVEAQPSAVALRAPIARDTFPVGRYRCTITFADGAIGTEWEPHFPGELSKRELKEYRSGRDAFIARTFPGTTVAVVEV